MITRAHSHACSLSVQYCVKPLAAVRGGCRCEGRTWRIMAAAVNSLAVDDDAGESEYRRASHGSLRMERLLSGRRRVKRAKWRKDREGRTIETSSSSLRDREHCVSPRS